MTPPSWPSTDFDTTRPAVLEDLADAPLLNSTVMMVDRDSAHIDAVGQVLARAGYRAFLPCPDADAALALLREREPALLLLDIHSSARHGLPLLQRIRGDEALRFLPVLAVVEEADAPIRQQALRLGTTDVLARSADASELVLRVRNALAVGQYQERNRHYDRGSGLPTRRLFLQQVRKALAASDPAQTWWAVLEAHVPECRQVADAFGAEAADQLARDLGARLQEVARHLREPGLGDGPNHALVARMGTADFALLVGGARQLDQLHDVARQTLAELARPVQLKGRQIRGTPVVGVALSGADGHTAEALLAGAEQARLLAAKRADPGYGFSSPELNRRALERVSQAANLRRALDHAELELHYQPQVDLPHGQFSGVEALVRWQLPNGTLLPPQLFLPMAEELGLSAEIGAWVLERACRDAAAWRAHGVAAGRLSVNVAPSQFARGLLARSVSRALVTSGLPPQHLALEISESLLMADLPMAMETLAELREIGVTLAVDDVGTGYLSLAHLKQLPVSELQLDRSLVAGLPGTPRDLALLRGLVALGHHLDLRVIAEGVETPEQRQAVIDAGCDGYQGFLFSRPLPAGELLAVLGAVV